MLCALPTLLSLPSHSHSQSALPGTFTMPLSHATSALPSSALDMQSFFPASSDFDWLDAMGANSGVDLDFNMDSARDDKTLASVTAKAASLSGNKLEFVSDDGESQLPLGDLGALDISFDALPSENGKIRVRIHPPSTSPSLSAADSPASSQQLDEDHAMTVSEASSAPSPARLEADAALGPFLGTGANLDFNALMGLNREDELAGLVDLDWDSVSSGFSRAGSPGASGSGRRRVRIALRSMPGKGREGGEWEVELC